MISESDSQEMEQPVGPQADEDWKAQVEAEKAAAEEHQQVEPEREEESQGDAAGEAAEVDEDAASTESQPDPVELPPASFDFLVVSLATQAMTLLGPGTDPETKSLGENLPMARHYIDLLAMLEEKTEGNRTDEETAILSNLLHQLRLLCVNVETSLGSDPAEEDSAKEDSAEEDSAEEESAEEESAEEESAEEESAEEESAEEE
jgi:hypothetical protein